MCTTVARVASEQVEDEVRPQGEVRVLLIYLWRSTSMCWGMGKTVQQDCTGKSRNIRVMAKDKGSVGM